MVSKITTPPSQVDLVDKVNEIIDDKQDTLISGTNIKTINNTSILGSGNISITAQTSWGSITGTLSDQTDLKNALDAKYDASNPNGYTSNVGTVTSVNNVSPVNGNVTLSIPTVTDTYSATSSDAMSGKAVASAVSGYVPTSRTVNGKALSSNISLSASDVGALPDSTVIPTVNNATLTIQKNGTKVKTFTANASKNVTANITVPTKVSDLTNDSGFISGITSSDVTTALGYTPYNSTNPSGYQANVIETVKVNNTALTPSSKAVNITVPTKVSDLTNDSGFISGITSSDVTTALGYTPYNSSNPSGYQANVIETVKVNGTALTPSSKAVNVSVPTESTVSGWGFTKNAGTVTSVNNVSPVNGNVSLSIPTVNNATLTITQGGTTKGTFTANASSNVTIDLDAGSSVDVDNKSITTNSSDQIQAIGVINSQDSSTAIKTWTGTKAQYDAITTKDSATLYNITDDTTITQTILEALYPVGSVYITTANTCPLSTLISGSTWTLVSSGIVKAGDIPCKGNGKTLGLTGNGALFQQNNAGLTSISGYVNSNAGTSVSGASWNNANLTVGVTTDSSKSGIIADTSSLTLSVNIYERTA